MIEPIKISDLKLGDTRRENVLIEVGRCEPLRLSEEERLMVKIQPDGDVFVRGEKVASDPEFVDDFHAVFNTGTWTPEDPETSIPAPDECPGHGGAVQFSLRGGEEVLRFEAHGEAYVDGELETDNKVVFVALKRWVSDSFEKEGCA